MKKHFGFWCIALVNINGKLNLCISLWDVLFVVNNPSANPRICVWVWVCVGVFVWGGGAFVIAYINEFNLLKHTTNWGHTSKCVRSLLCYLVQDMEVQGDVLCWIVRSHITFTVWQLTTENVCPRLAITHLGPRLEAITCRGLCYFCSTFIW